VAVGYSQRAVAQPLAEVYSGAAAPGNASLPTIGGHAASGSVLSETHGSWTNGPSGYAEQWQRCDQSGGNCSPISGATAQQYTLTGSDVGHTLRVRETASGEGGTSAPATSNATAVVARGGVRPPPTPTRARIKAQLLKQITGPSQGDKIGQLLKLGRVRLPFSALTAGRVVIHWWYRPAHGRKEVLIATAGGRFSRATNTTLELTLTTAGKQLLIHASRLAVEARAEFLPVRAAGVFAAESFTLRR
jgi:hypothetical protein